MPKIKTFKKVENEVGKVSWSDVSFDYWASTFEFYPQKQMVKNQINVKMI